MPGIVALYAFRFIYDTLRRPLQSFVQGGDPSDPSGEVFAQEILFEQTVYGDSPDTGLTPSQQNRQICLGESFAVPTARAYYRLRSMTSKAIHMTPGGPARTADDKTFPDWSPNPRSKPRSSPERLQYDALNRAIAMTAPDGSVLERTFNRTVCLERLDLQGTQQNGQPADAFRVHIEYDAKGQRSQIDYGNAVTTTYPYDPETFRLTNLVTSRSASSFPGDCPQPPVAGWPGCQVQNLVFTYDPIGNITTIRDDAPADDLFSESTRRSVTHYTYDPLYRLIEATGREHLGQGGGGARRCPTTTAPEWGFFSPAATAMPWVATSRAISIIRSAIFSKWSTAARLRANTGWTRSYPYAEPSLLDPGQVNNRLTSNTVGTGTESIVPAATDMTPTAICCKCRSSISCSGTSVTSSRTPRGRLLTAVTRTACSIKENALTTFTTRRDNGWESYGASGRRRTDSNPNEGAFTSVILKSIENTAPTERPSPSYRQSLHVMDNRERIALVETRTKGNDGSPAQLVRYQFTNQLGSAIVELDDAAQVITYEEYFPYGSTSYQTVRSQTETPKRYRYTGMERDEESGLNYHAKRYYATWLGRWTAADPIGIGKEVNLFGYSMQNPINKVDPDGIGSLSAWGLVRGKIL